MCGIAGMFGRGAGPGALRAMAAAQRHRGPDDQGLAFDAAGPAGLAHTRLSILDLTPAGRQPMACPEGRYRIAFNGEVYNYRELRAALPESSFSTGTDTEVVLAAYRRWGEACLDRFVGMFAFAIWDRRERRLFAARDRFGVKPLYTAHLRDGTLLLASEIKALHAAGLAREPDETAWATWLAHGWCDQSPRTFWSGVSALAPGTSLTWQQGRVATRTWYDLAARSGPDLDARPEETVADEYAALLAESVRLRFRSDVPVGINLSGGLDSSTLLALVHRVQGEESAVRAFTFACGDPAYDETPWVERMLASTRHPATVCRLAPEEVPALAASVQETQDEPFGGLPTLAYARLFEQAREQGVPVLLDGQGMDEQWAGYDYYREGGSGLVQGTKESPVRPGCLAPAFAARAEPFDPPCPFPDRLRNLQLRDARYLKLPRALRFNDRASMRASCELREPFLDHRLFELALRQPPERKISGGTGKVLLRRIAARFAPGSIVEAPKRPLQTPQREWLRGPLRAWTNACIEEALRGPGRDWLDRTAVLAAWDAFQRGASDNSFYVWQWVSLGMLRCREPVPA
ncbi:MAG: asparagine synthase (glutamine-hydrolyzing) [Planctomycetaceae bacterium]